MTRKSTVTEAMEFQVLSKKFSMSAVSLCVIVLLCNLKILGVAAESRFLNPFSIRLGNVDLFNIPPFARSLFGVTEGYDGKNVLDGSTVDYPGLDPDVVEDAILKTPELIKKYGYPEETHHVTTQDGYILEMHRIARENAIPVLLTHGLLDSSATWVLMGPNKGLAYYLYDLGYDIWMTNVRGNKYSRGHTFLTTKDADYWNFSFHEMGKYDLPATIDYVLNATNKEQLHYIGHSQGTAAFWVMCSERPQYSDKILLMQALAPVAFIKHCKSPVVNFLAFFQLPLSMLLYLIGAHEFLPSNEFVSLFTQMICDDDTITKDICTNVIFSICGFDKKEMNETMLPVALGHAPAGASTKQLQHFGQLRHSGYFRQYDYGIKNIWHYGTTFPPEYKLQNVLNKVALHYSQNDWLAPPEDVENLHQKLPNVIGKFLVGYHDFNHLDFVWGTDVRELLYKRVAKLMSLVERGEL